MICDDCLYYKSEVLQCQLDQEIKPNRTECSLYRKYIPVSNPKQDTIMDQAKAVLELQQHGDTMQTMGIMTGGFISGLRKAGISDEIILQILPVYFRTVLKIKGE